MKVLFDNQIFILQNFGGISRYFYELMKALKGSVEYKLPLIVSNNTYLLQDKSQKRFSFSPNKEFRGKGFLIKNSNKLAFVYEAKIRKWDIIHPTYYDTSFMKYINQTPFVITVHDMIHEKFFQHDKETIENKKKCITQADRIIAISENTKKDIIDIYNIAPEKIDVIYHGCSINPEVEQKIENLPQKYILFAGSRDNYKNFSRFVKAMSCIIKKYQEYHVVCTGSPFSEKEKQLLLNCNLYKQTHLYFAKENELTYLYKNATAFAFTSEYEGFGIPILEAFTCGCPVALSKTSCFPEIAKDAGTYFDPLDAEDIEHSLLKLIEDADYRKKCITLGYQRAKNFSWSKTAQETLMTYNKVLAKM